MPKTKAQNELIKSRRREDIVQSSLKLFATKGFDNVTINDITDASGCSHGLFYHYFESKADVLKAIVENLQQDTRGYFEQFEKQKHQPKEFLIATIKRIIDEFNNPRSLQFVLKINIWFTIPLQKTIPAPKKTKGEFSFESPFPLIVEVIQLGQLAGDFRTDHSARDYAMIGYALMQSLATNRLSMNFRRFRAPSAESIISIFVK